MLVPFLRAALIAVVLLAGCGGGPWNNPYPASEAGANILYSSFSERPKHLDPVQSYSENEYVLIANIYQPPLQYHYFKRPYELVPFAATEVPRPQFYDAADRRLPDTADAKEVAYSEYMIRIRPGILYQPHPALARDGSGRAVYHDLKPGDRGRAGELAGDEGAPHRAVVGEGDERGSVHRAHVDLEVVEQGAGVARASQSAGLAQRSLVNDVVAHQGLLDQRNAARLQRVERVVAAGVEHAPLGIGLVGGPGG